MASSTARAPILGFQTSIVLAASLAAYNYGRWANNGLGNQAVAPTGRRSLRLCGVNNVNHVAGQTNDIGEANVFGWSRENLANLRPPGVSEGSVSLLQGDPIHCANAAGQSEPYRLGTGTTMVMGFSREQYVNNGTTPVPFVLQLSPHLVVQAMEVRGFTRAVAANNTRYIGNDATELSAVETLFEAPWDGVLQGPLRISVEASGGTPAGTITVSVMVKPPGGSWAPAQVGTTPADWSVALAASGSVTAASDVTAALPNGNSLAIVAGTKVGFKSVKNSSVANVAQLNARVAFV
jgi:hypothetical protein